MEEKREGEVVVVEVIDIEEEEEEEESEDEEEELGEVVMDFALIPNQ